MKKNSTDPDPELERLRQRFMRLEQLPENEAIAFQRPDVIGGARNECLSSED